MTKARTNASASPAAGRNMIINGAMNVAQRSASVTGIGAADGYFTLDRWQINVGATSAGRLTMTQTADGPNGISANCLKLDCTTADTSIAAGELLQIMHKMEGQNLQRIGKGVAGAKQVTVSFYVKGNASATYVAELFDADNTRSIGALFSVTTDWTRVVIVFPADVDDGSSPYGDDNALSLSLLFTLHAGSDFTSAALNTTWSNNDTTKRAAGGDSFFDATTRTFFLTGVQMEVGPVATEFEQEDFDVTYQKCLRYTNKLVFGVDATAFGLGYAESTSQHRTPFKFSKMRAAPTVTFSGATDFAIVNGGTGVTSTSIAASAMSDSMGLIHTTHSGAGLTLHQPLYIRCDAGKFIMLDSEL